MAFRRRDCCEESRAGSTSQEAAQSRLLERRHSLVYSPGRIGCWGSGFRPPRLTWKPSAQVFLEMAVSSFCWEVIMVCSSTASADKLGVHCLYIIRPRKGYMNETSKTWERPSTN